MDNSILLIQPLSFPWHTRDPFLFAVHHRDAYPAGDGQLAVPASLRQGRTLGNDFVIKDGFRMYHGQSVPGFPVHPHRGFETITINREGLVDHSDSMGAAGRFGAGDVQWMTAGKGIQHAEMFPLVHAKEENPLEIFQIWLNLPARNKLVEPHFKMLWNNMIPTLEKKDPQGKKTTIQLIAGEHFGQKAPAPTPDSWAADPENGVMVVTLQMEAGASWTLPASQHPGVVRTLYFYQGISIEVNGESIQEYHRIDLDPQADVNIRNGSQEARFLMLQGRPIAEPVAMYGPFAMNTQEEISSTFEEYRRTQFGGWPWPDQAPHHGPEAGRFARHADGREEHP